MTNRDNRRLFYVIQFIELPFESIDDYVCVPHSWLIKQRPSDRKVVVTYPNNEDPFDTKDRVKSKERPNDEWRLYTALIKYESENYKDAEYWITMRNDCGHGEEEFEIGDIQSEPVLNRKLRSASQFFWSGLNPDKPQLTVKPYENVRKPLSRMSIRRPLSQSPDRNLDNKRLKLNGNVKPGIVTDHVIIESGHSKQGRSRIITDNQLIQNDPTKTSFTSNGEMNTEQSTQSEVIEENQSVDMSVQSSSKKPLAEQQPSPKLTLEQQLSPEFSAGQQSLPVGLDYQQRLSISERTFTKTPPNTLEQKPQPEPINERSTLLVHHDHSLSESYRRYVSGRQSKKPNDSQKTHLNCTLTALTIVPRPPSTSNQPIQQYVHSQLPISPVSSTLYSKSKPQGTDESNSIKVVHNHKKPRSQGFMFGNKPSTSCHEFNCNKLSQLFTKSAKKQSPVAKNLKNPVDKKTNKQKISHHVDSKTIHNKIK